MGSRVQARYLWPTGLVACACGIFPDQGLNLILAGGFSTAGLPGKSHYIVFFTVELHCVMSLYS